MSPGRALLAITTATMTALAVLCAALIIAVLLVEPSAPSEPSALVEPPPLSNPSTALSPRLLSVLFLGLTPLGLLYFSVASFAAVKASRPRPTLAVGAVLTGTAVGLWSGVGSYADSLWGLWLSALGFAVALSLALWLGSEVLLRVGMQSRAPGARSIRPSPHRVRPLAGESCASRV